MSYVTPQVKVYQEFTSSTSADEGERRAWIVGPNGILHRYSESAEKPDILLGSVLKDNITNTTLPYPGQESAGSTIDASYVKVFADNAKLRYANVENSAYNLVGYSNVLTFADYNSGAGLNLVTNGTYQRNAVFGSRDVKVGDTVRLTAYAASGNVGASTCDEAVFESKITGFLPTMLPPTTAAVTKEANANLYKSGVLSTYNPESGTITGVDAEVLYTVKVTSVEDTTVNYTSTNTATNTSNDYSLTYASGSNTFTLETGKTVAISLTSSPAANDTYYVAGLYTYGTAPSGDSVAATSTNTNVTLAITGTFNPYKYGVVSSSYTVTVTRVTNTVACKVAEVTIASDLGVVSGVQVPLGDTASNTGTFYLDSANTLTGTFTGQISKLSVGDKYTFTLGNTYKPAIVAASGAYTGDEDTTYIITCLEGGVLGTSNPTVTIASADGEEFFTGKLSTTTANGIVSASVEMPRGMKFTFYGINNNKELATNAVYSVAVTASTNGPVRALQLKDSLPTAFRTFDIAEKNYLNVAFCIVKNVELDPEQYTATDSTITLNETLAIEDPDFTSLTLIDADIYVQYREWVTQGTNVLTIVSSLEEISAIPGQLDPDNLLKYGVYKAFANSNGTSVAYTAVSLSDINDSDAWAEAFATGSGSTEVYTLVPLTQNITIQNLAASVVNADSSEDTCAWKHAIFSTSVDVEKTLAATTGVVLQNATTGAFTRVVIDPEKETDLSGVAAGDVIRVMYRSVLTEYVIDSVTSANELELLSGPASQIGLGTEQGGNLTYVAMTIVHKMSRADQVAEVCAVAGSFSNRRISLVWPDQVGEGGVVMPGYMLCAAIAGLMSGVQPHQGLTHVEIAGFDDFSRSAPYFSPAQIKQLASNGVWVCTTDKDGTPYTYHALTTDMTDLNTQEEMITRNMDSISLYFADLLKPYIGTTNTTDEFLEQLHLAIQFACDRFTVSTNSSIGARISTYSIESVERDVLLRDHVRVLLNVELPMATNVISLYIYA